MLCNSTYMRSQKIKLICSDREWTHQGVPEDGERGKKGTVTGGHKETPGIMDSLTTLITVRASQVYMRVKT